MQKILRRFLPLSGAAILLCGTACKIFQHREAMIKVISHKDDSRFHVRVDGDKAIIEIFSESGIGDAAFEFIDQPMPKQLAMRFHLRGLEELRFAYGETVVTVALSSTGDNDIRQSINRAGGESVATQAASPYWMKLRLASRDKIPLREGYIEVEAPEDFFASGARKISIQWIDFYR